MCINRMRRSVFSSRKWKWAKISCGFLEGGRALIRMLHLHSSQKGLGLQFSTYLSMTWSHHVGLKNSLACFMETSSFPVHTWLLSITIKHPETSPNLWSPNSRHVSISARQNGISPHCFAFLWEVKYDRQLLNPFQRKSVLSIYELYPLRLLAITGNVPYQAFNYTLIRMLHLHSSQKGLGLQFSTYLSMTW